MNHLNFIKSLKQYPQKSHEWFEDRKKRLTSSDAATALGINPYKKNIELLFEKCGIKKVFTENVNTIHGNKYEQEAIGHYERLMGKKNHEFGMIGYESLNELRDQELNDEKYNFLGGSPDGISEDIYGLEPLVMLEVKCPLKRKIIHGQIPEYYLPQVQLNMFILDLKIADFVEYIPPIDGKNMELNIVRIYRNNKWFDENVPKLINFWNHVIEWRKKDITQHPEYLKYHAVPVFMFRKEPEIVNSLEV